MFRPKPGERGMALIIVVVVMVVVLMGGLAAVAFTSGELTSTHGYRTQAMLDACGYAALERMRAMAPDATFADAEGSMSVNGMTLSFKGGHYSGTVTATDEAFSEISGEQVDMTALFEGENITNSLGAGGNLKLLTTTVTCESSDGNIKEFQLVMRHGVPR